MANEEPEELKRLEDSLVHDDDEGPMPQGWGIYFTPKFLARNVLIAYGVMLVGVLITQVIYHGVRIPIVLMPAAALVALPFAIVALYLNIVSAQETALIAQRTRRGRALALLATYLGLQVITMALWVGIILAFKVQ